MFDAYLRLALLDVDHVIPVHIRSCIEPRKFGGALDSADVYGTTEWTAFAARTLTFGWDWTYVRRAGIWSADWSSLGTNLMVTDASGADLGPEAIQACVASLMERARWSDVVAHAVGLPAGE